MDPPSQILDYLPYFHTTIFNNKPKLPKINLLIN